MKSYYYHNTINPCKIKSGDRFYNFFINIRISKNNDGMYILALSGKYRTTRGQIDNLLEDKNIKLKKSYSVYDIITLKFIWKTYHLNSLQAGTQRQINFLSPYKKLSYDKQVELLKNNGLLYDNGIRYGSTWLFKVVPNDVIEYLKNLK